MSGSPVVLVTGAGGFLGSALVSELSQRGRNHRAAVRAMPEVVSDGGKVVVVGDIAQNTDWSQALSGIDAVIHCAARAHVLKDVSTDPLQAFRQVNVEATLALAQQAQAAGVRRFVFVSSIGVNGSITHGVPFRPDDQPAPHSPYAVSKLEAEQVLTELCSQGPMQLVIVRPPLVIGPDAKGNLATLQNVIARGLPLPFAGAGANRRDFVSLNVLCDVLIRCVDHPAASGRTFLVSDGKPLSTKALVLRLGEGVGRSARLFYVPSIALRTLLRLAGKSEMAKQLLDDLEIDIEATRQTLNWHPDTVPPLPPATAMG